MLPAAQERKTLSWYVCRPSAIRVVRRPVDHRRDLDRVIDRRAGARAHLDDLVIVTTGVEVGRVEERDVDATVCRNHRRRDKRLVEAAGDQLRRAPCITEVVRDRVVDLRRDEAAFLPEGEVAVGHDRVAVAPRCDVFLVEQVTDARFRPAAGCDADLVPRLAAVARVGNEHVGVRRVGRPTNRKPSVL